MKKKELLKRIQKIENENIIMKAELDALRIRLQMNRIRERNPQPEPFKLPYTYICDKSFPPYTETLKTPNKD